MSLNAAGVCKLRFDQVLVFDGQQSSQMCITCAARVDAFALSVPQESTFLDRLESQGYLQSCKVSTLQSA